MGRNIISLVEHSPGVDRWERGEHEPDQGRRRPSVTGVASDAPLHLARAQQAVAKAREVASRSSAEKLPAADSTGVPPPHLSKAKQAVAKARDVAARYRATYGSAPPGGAAPEKQPLMPDLPWEKQKLKLDLSQDKQPLRLDLPKAQERRRLDLPDLAPEPPKVEAAPAPTGDAGTARFTRTSAAARRNIPADPNAEPWSCLPLDQLNGDRGSRWRKLLSSLAVPWGGPRRRVDRRREARVSPPPHDRPFAIATKEPDVGRAVPPGRGRVERPVDATRPGGAASSARGGAAGAQTDDGAEASELGPLPAARAPVPLPAQSFHRAERTRVRRRWQAQVLDWLLGRGTTGAGQPAGAQPPLQAAHPDGDEDPRRGAAPTAAGALTVARTSTLPMLLPRLPVVRAMGVAGGRRTTASWRLATRTLLVGGLGVLCGALLTELLAQPRGNLLNLVVQWWQPESAAPQQTVVPAPDRPEIEEPAAPESAALTPAEGGPPAERAGGAAAAVAEPEAEPAAGPPESERPVPVPRPAAADTPDWSAITAALDAAQDDPGSDDLARIIRADPHRWDAFYDLGHRLQVQGHLREAGALYREAARIDPTHAATFYDWGYVLQRQGDQDGAIDKYRTAIRLHSKNPYAFYNLGFLLQRRGDLAGAIEHYQIAADLGLRNPFLYFNWGSVLERQGDIAAAIARYREASRLQPDASPGTDARVRIAELSAHRDGASASN